MAQQREGLRGDFEAARVVVLTTYDEEGKPRSRPMTNIGGDPSALIWFASYAGTRKVADIERDPRASVSFPASAGGSWTLTGTAQIAPDEEVERRWRFWPDQLSPQPLSPTERPTGDPSFADHRRVIFFYPTSTAKIPS